MSCDYAGLTRTAAARMRLFREGDAAAFDGATVRELIQTIDHTIEAWTTEPDVETWNAALRAAMDAVAALPADGIVWRSGEPLIHRSDVLNALLSCARVVNSDDFGSELGSR